MTKRNVWYLVARTDVDDRSAAPDVAEDIRTFRLGRVRSIEILDQPVVRPKVFDLDDVWDGIVTEVERRRSTIKVKAIVEPQLLTPIRWVFGAHQTVAEAESTSHRADGRVAVVIDAHSPRSFAAQIAGFGGGVELVEPPAEVLAELADLGRLLYDRYCQ